MPKPSTETTNDWRSKLKSAGLIRVEVWVKNNPKSIAEAKALDMKHTVKRGDKDGRK